ncbi:hypothetical protein [Carnobacterium sp.]
MVYTGFTKPEDLTADMAQPTYQVQSLDEWVL